MSKKEKQIYLIVGKIICDITGCLLMVAVPVGACYLVGLISHIILGG